MATPEGASSSPSSLFPESSCVSVFKMTKGSVMLKAKRNGTPQFKKFVLSRDLLCLHWGSPRKAGDKSVLISNMTELIKGQKTKVFQHFPVPQSELSSFSVVYKIGRGVHTVDVVCMNKQQFDLWTIGLQALINGFCDKMAIDKLYDNEHGDETDYPPVNKTEEIALDVLGPGGKDFNEDACDLYTWGDGTTGMLGHGENNEENVPRMVEALLSRDINKVACGVTHTMVVTKEGEVFSWGSGSCGKLGQGHLRDRSTPLRVAELKDKKVVKVACHEFHSSAVCASGELYTWGKVGPHLGFEGSSRKEVLPKLVPGLLEHKVVHVACGLSHTLACTKTGKCFAFGDNTLGQLGIEGIALSYEPMCIEELKGYPISFTTCGNNHSAALSGNGYLWLWGANDCGQLGTSNLPSLTKPFPLPISAELRNPIITDVSCGAKHTVFLAKKGRLFGMGDNTENQLGINQRGKLDEQLQRVSSPVRIHLPSHSKHAKLVQVSCGAFHTAAVTEAGEIFAWGKGRGGGLGHGDGKDRSLPCELDMDGKRVRSVTCGATHTACLVTRAWISEDLIKNCMACKAKFSLVNRKHHCRKCGGVYCASCTLKRAPILTLPGYRIPRRVCDKCYAIVLEDT